MNYRLRSILSVTLVLILGLGQLASALERPINSRPPGSRREINTAKTPLARRLQSPETGIAGRSRTLLSDGRLLMIGGQGPSGLTSTVEAANQDSMSTSLLTTLKQPRAWHTATVMPDGTVLILGGIGERGQLLSAPELFDPEIQTYKPLELSSTRSFTPRAHHTATLMTDGRVLITGGLGKNGNPINQVELFDFQTRSVTRLKSTLKAARYGHSATLMADGRVLIKGGSDKNGSVVTASEVFNPETELITFTREGDDGDIRLQSSDQPKLEESIPADGAMSVAIDSRLAFRFSEPLQVTSLTFDTAILAGPDGVVPSRVIAAEEGRLAFINPMRSLRPGTEYRVTLSSPVDESDQPLETTTILFKTAGVDTPDFVPVTDEDWLPDDASLKGDWRSRREPSPWEKLPLLEAKSGLTALSGRVLTLNGMPLSGVTIKIGQAVTRTDRTGRFLLEALEPGHRELIIDGITASKPGKHYGVFEIGTDLTATKTNKLEFTIWMPKLDTANEITIDSPTRSEVVVTTPCIPGLEVHIPAGTVIRDHDGKVVTRIGITPIPVDRPPFPLPLGVDVPIYFTVQPGGAYLQNARYGSNVGARIIYPNYRKEAAGVVNNFWHYDPEEQGWYVYGKGKISQDATQVIPDYGVSVREFTGAMIGTQDWAKGPPPCAGCGGTDGDPVDLSTGLFMYQQTDLVLPDLIPIAITRTYRPNDAAPHSFGVGTSFFYEAQLYDARPNGEAFKEVYFLLPGGSRFRFDRVAGDTNYNNVVLEHTGTPSMFHKATMKWNGKGWDVRLKDGTVFVFGEVAPLQAIRDRYGNQVTITRTDGQNGNIKRIATQNGRWIEFTYSSLRITQTRDNIGRTVSYQYDQYGRLSLVTDAAGGMTEYTYDSSHRMLTIKDARGIVYLMNEYDGNGRVTKQTQADQTTYQFAYTLDGSGKVTQTNVTDPRGNPRNVTFNSNGYILTDTKGCCGGQARTYERQPGTNFVLSMTDALNRQTAYAYDAMGNVTSVTSLSGTPEAVTTSFTYEPVFNQVASVTDPLNHTTTLSYDLKGSPTSVIDPLNHSTTIAYNGAGQRLSVSDSLGNTTQLGYTGSDLTSITNPLNQTVKRFYDGAGRLLSVRNPLGLTARYEYDQLNRVTKVTDPLLGETRFSHDPNGNLLSLTDARNNVTSYVYDSMDRVTTRRDPLLRNETYQFDENGNLKQVTDRKSQVTMYSYDSLDRLTQVRYHDASTIDYSFDNGNRLLQAADSSSSVITWSYDNLDRMLSETTAQGTVSYTHDATGRRTTMTVPGQSMTTYGYDNADRLTQITQGSLTVTMAYDAADRSTSMTLPNGVVTEYSYDIASRLTGINYRNGSTVLGNLSYDYDAIGRRVRIGGSFARTLLPQEVASTSYNAANHQLQFGSKTLTYDLNGNLIADGINTYTWNARDQLVAISGPGVGANFQYDAIGRRSTKTIAGYTTTFLYDDVNLVQELTGSSPTANLLTGAVDQFFSRTDSSGTATPLTDALGSTLTLVDSSASILTQYTYDPFGNTSGSGGASANAQKYTGREDDGTGLYYFRARYYSPTQHRFISEDPIEIASGDANLYAFVGNNPIVYTDPSGLERFPSQTYIGHAQGIAERLGGRKGPNLLDAEYAFRAWFAYSRELEESGRPWASRGARLMGSIADIPNGGGRITDLPLCGQPVGDPPIPLGKGFNRQQAALIKIAKEARQRGGVTLEECDILRTWAKELGLLFRGPEVHPGRPFGSQPHIHVGPVNHIPVR